MKFSVLIVDDEPLARHGVVLRLRAHPDLDVIGECANGNDALEAIRQRKPDLVFLDIQMPLLNGIDVMRALAPEETPYTIFLTAFDEYVMQAFEVHAIAYLLKPIDSSRFDAALRHARRVLGGTQTASYQEGLRGLLKGDGNPSTPAPSPLKEFAVRTGKQVTFVPVDDIDWIEAQGDYAQLHVGKREYLLRESLTVLESRLDPGSFLRIHRSAIVRIQRIMRVDSRPNRDCMITLASGMILRVSRTYSHHLRNLLRNGARA
jgi:two-component system, LytTR family, response regulator